MQPWLPMITGLALTAGVACQGASAGTEDSGALMDADRAFDLATQLRRTDGWVNAFAENGLMIQPGAMTEGHAAIRESMAGAFADTTFTLSWEPQRAALSSGGDLGYTIGRYRTRRTGPGGKLLQAEGTYLTVWVKQADGSWKVAADIGNQDPPTSRGTP